jgi:paraquat-inducible protein B
VGSRFWLAGGVDVNLGLFRGLEVSVESLRALVAGGIAFATPGGPKIPVPPAG